MVEVYFILPRRLVTLTIVVKYLIHTAFMNCNLNTIKVVGKGRVLSVFVLFFNTLTE